MLSDKPWRAGAVIQFVVAQTGCLCFGMVAVGLLHKLGARGFHGDASLGSVAFGTLSFQGVSWLLIGFFLREHEMTWGAAFGWRGRNWKRALLAAFGFIIVALPVILALQAASIRALDWLGFPSDDEAAVKLVTDAHSPWTIAYLGLFAIVLAPVAEEFIFRGMLYPFFKRFRPRLLVEGFRHAGWPRLAWFVRTRFWRLFAWFGVSFLFALIHFNLATLTPLFVFALALTWLYEVTDSLLAPIAAHALFNATNFAMLLWQLHDSPT